MKLFFIDHEQEGGDNIQLFVVANTVDDAIRFWWDYYGIPVDERELPNQIFALPDLAGRKAGPLHWHKDLKPECEAPVATAMLAMGVGKTMETVK